MSRKGWHRCQVGWPLPASRTARRRLTLCIVKTAPPTKSRTYAPLEFRAEDGETPPLCSTLRYWAKISQRRHPGRPRIDAEIRRLVRTMAQDGWGAPRIHAELTKLGFIISESTVSRYLPRRPAEPDQLKRWMAFLRNHKDDIAAMDLFTVPTASLRLLYGFFVIEHGRRHIVHFNATFHPTSAWVIQQLREAFPYDTAPRYLIFDRDFIFNAAVIEFIKATGTKPVRTSFRSPWQNGTAERWVGSCRRELLEHVVVLGACHLIRLVRAYISYYHEDRCHLGLNVDCTIDTSGERQPESAWSLALLGWSPRSSSSAPSLAR